MGIILQADGTIGTVRTVGRGAVVAVVPLLLVFGGAVSAPLAGVLITPEELTIDALLGATAARLDLVVFLVLALLDAAPFTRTAWLDPRLRAAGAAFVAGRIGVHLGAGQLAAPGLAALCLCAMWFGLTAVRTRR